MTVPVGPATLGRMLDVTGSPMDGGGPLPPGTPRWPIHRKPPPLAYGGKAAMTVSEYIRDEMGRDVLLLIDNVFRFVQAGAEVSGLLGWLPSRVGYQPTLATEIADLEKRGTSGRETFVFVRRGVLSVRGGRQVDIAARGAWAHDDLERLWQEALARLQAAEEEEAERRTAETRMHLAAMRQIERLLAAARTERALRPGRERAPGIAPEDAP